MGLVTEEIDNGRRVFCFPNYHSRSFDFSRLLPIAAKVEAFLDRVHGWQLHIADELINGRYDENGNIVGEIIPHSGFAALRIAASYFEMIARYEASYTGLGESKHYFKKGITTVFPDIRNFAAAGQALDLLYTQLRSAYGTPECLDVVS
jgi:hypothetical protein